MPTKSITYNKKRISANINSDADESVFNEIFVERDYKALEEIIKNAKDPIIDVGAHIGVFAVYIRTLNDKVKIFAYEPGNENFKALKENLKLNHLEKNIIAKNLAVAGTEGVKPFYLSQDSHNHSLINKSENIQKAQAVTLPKILGKIDNCYLIKMDCEGAEFEILKSMEPADFKKIKNIYIEYHEYLPELKSGELKKILEKNGFKTKLSPSHYDKRMGFLFASSQTK